MPLLGNNDMFILIGADLGAVRNASYRDISSNYRRDKPKRNSSSEHHSGLRHPRLMLVPAGGAGTEHRLHQELHRQSGTDQQDRVERRVGQLLSEQSRADCRVDWPRLQHRHSTGMLIGPGSSTVTIQVCWLVQAPAPSQYRYVDWSRLQHRHSTGMLIGPGSSTVTVQVCLCAIIYYNIHVPTVLSPIQSARPDSIQLKNWKSLSFLPVGEVLNIFRTGWVELSRALWTLWQLDSTQLNWTENVQNWKKLASQLS